MDITINLLLDILDRGFDKASWHGPNLLGSIRGVDEKLAARHMHGRKSIWQQVMHAAYWKKRALNRLIGTQDIPLPASNWPRVPAKVTLAAWKADIELLRDIHEKLKKGVAGLNRRKLNQRAQWLIYGVAMHDVYHAGQIKLLRRMAKRQAHG